MQEQTIEGYRLSPEQRRLWLLQQDNHAPRAACALAVEGGLDRDVLREAVRRVVGRHEILRATYPTLPGTSMPLQVILDDAPFDYGEVDLRHLDAAEHETEIDRRLREQGQTPFDFGRGPLARFRLLAFSAERHVLLFTLPALCADAQSLANLCDEIGRSYAAALVGEEPLEEAVQYIQFSEWQNDLADSEEGEEGREFWRQRNAAPFLDPTLPYENAAAGTAQSNGDSVEPGEVSTELDGALVSRLAALAADASSTLPLCLLAAFHALLRRLQPAPLAPDSAAASTPAGSSTPAAGSFSSGGSAVAVAALFDGRRFAELGAACGPFARYLPTVSRYAPGLRFAELLRQLTADEARLRGWQEYFDAAAEGAAPAHDTDTPAAETDTTADSAGAAADALMVADSAGAAATSAWRLPSVGFDFLPAADSAARAGLLFAPRRLAWSSTPFKLRLSCVASGHGAVRASFEYDPRAFAAHDVAELAERYEALLRGAAAAGSTAPVEQLPVVGPRERRRLLRQWSGADAVSAAAGVAPETVAADAPAPDAPAADTAAEQWGGARTVHEAFERRAALCPHAPALLADTEPLTFAHLNARANRLARLLRRRGVGPESVVGLLLGRGAEQVAALLAVWKAGGAYLPLDAEAPAARLGHMLAEAGARLVLTHTQVSEDVRRGVGGGAAVGRVEVLCLDDESARAEVSAQSDADLTGGPAALPDNLAYVIYTSGSTGRPKGVMVTHGSVLNLARALRGSVYADVAEGAGLRVSLNAPLVFDASVKQLVQLLSGHTLVAVPEEVRRDAGALAGYVRGRRVEVLDCTPSQLRVLLDAGLLAGGEGEGEAGAASAESAGGEGEAGGGGGESARGSALRKVLVGGEAVDVRLWERLAGAGGVARAYNVYGPTECTVDATAREVSGGGGPRLGGALAGVELYVLDGRGELAPSGAVGELYVGGRGVGRGYVKDPVRTAERFVPHPFSEEAGARLYRTGDLVRWEREGELEFVGRADGQVKVRGYRVEVGEVEAALRGVEGVREAAVGAVSGGEGGDQRLVAYVVMQKESELSVKVLREALKDKLPTYMLPAAFVQLDRLPLTARGKVDRQALPAPEQAAMTDEDYVAPRTPTEEMIAGLLSELLKMERVSVEANFFALGGHSLLATQFLWRVTEVFQVEVSLRSLFEQPTVASLARNVEVAIRAERGVQTPPLRRVWRDTPPPLSFAQQRLWFLDQLEPDSSAYNMPAAVRLTGELNLAALEEALNQVVARHEVLRTTFELEGATAVQIIHPPVALPLTLTDLGQLADDARDAEVRRLAAETAQLPFDLARGPLVRARLLRLGADEHVLLLTMHHIVSDGWSMGVLIKEVAAGYAAARNGEPSPLPELPIQYADYAAWQREWLQGAVLEQQLQYWREHLAGAPALLELPTDFPRPPVQSFRGASHAFAVDPELAAALHEVARREGVTLFMLLLAGLQLALSRATGQEDVVVGTPIAGRNQQETEGLIGFFVNTLALRTRLGGDPTLGELLAGVREVCLGAYAHQDVPFEKLVEELEPERSMSHTPLFQVMLVLQNTPEADLRLPGLRLSPVTSESTTTQFDLVFSFTERGGGLRGQVQYNTALFAAETAERLTGQLMLALRALAGDRERRAGAVGLLTQEERARALASAGAPGPLDSAPAEAETAGGVHELLERQAALRPEALAVVGGEVRLSYAELNEEANRLAHYLRGRGVGPESVVGLLLGRTPDAVVAQAAVLKAGGAYLPLDAEAPAARLGHMLEEAGVRLVLSQMEVSGELREEVVRESAGGLVEVLCLDDESVRAEVSAQGGANPGARTEPEQLAYIIYTSGSTGLPKGVMVSHGSLSSLARAQAARFGLRAEDRLLQFVSFTFDVAAADLWMAFSSGAALLLASDEARAGGTPLAAAIDRHRVTALQLPVAVARTLPHDAPLPTLRLLVVGGEQCDAELAARWAGGRRFFNAYGPTEATVCASAERCEAGEVRERGRVALGRALAGAELYVLDGRGELAPAGAVGELYIGGRGVGRGYVKDPVRTAERFVPHPFSGEAGARLYRTGDLGRRLGDGRVEYVGRGDGQVKVRGYRVEVGEVEAALRGVEGVREAAVAAAEDGGGGRRLAAFVVAAEGRTPAMGELRSVLRRTLPEYMVPSRFMLLNDLPLTPNGKIDREALVAFEQARPLSESAYVAPRTPTEEMLAGILADVLRVEQVGIHDNFFELGGHSLMATQLMSRVREVFQVEVPLRSLFELPTVAGFAQSVEMEMKIAQGLQSPPILPAPRDGELPLSFSQQRLWFLDQLKQDNAFYNMPTAVRLTGELQLAAMERTLTEIVRRHESLRTRFVTADGRAAQVVEPPADMKLTVIDLSGMDDDERRKEARRLGREEARRPFDLTRGHLMRVKLLRLGDDNHVLLLTMHHIVSDGWSMGVLMKEMAALYKAYVKGEESPLEEPPIQYADYAVWQRGWLQGEVLEQQLGYWREQLAGAPPLLSLPTDGPRPPVQTHRGAHVSLLLPKALADGVKALTQREGATLFMTMLAAYAVLLSRQSGQQDVVVGTPIAGRNRAETEGLIGFFVNTLVLRTRLGGNPTFRELLGRVREVALGAYAHQDVPFEKLVEELQPERNPSYTPLFQVMLVLQNAPMPSLKLQGIVMNQLEMHSETARHDLHLSVMDTRHGMIATLTYNTDLFHAARCTRMLEQLQALLTHVVAQPEATLESLSEALDEEDRRQLAAQEQGFKEASLQQLKGSRRRGVSKV